MVKICLAGLVQRFRSFQMTIYTREKTPSFFDLQLMLLVEENHEGALRSTPTNIQMMYKEVDRPQGRGGLAHNNGGRYEQRQNRREDNR